MKPFNKYFDHTLLKADATEMQVVKLLAEAAEYDFASVCVNSCFVSAAAEYLQDMDVKVASVVGFPLGAMAMDAKAGEVRTAIADGADEIDMVVNIGAVKDGRWDYVRHEISLLTKICHEAKAKDGGPVLLKVILETCLLTEDEIVLACKAAKRAGADFVKTSTGFSTGGATAEHVKLMRKTVGDTMQIKASGGIRTRKDAQAMIDAGADRLGCSASVAIMENRIDISPKTKGYVHVYTGDGKGKTTAALGLAMRAAGAGMKVYIGEFIKEMEYSEIGILRKRFPEVTVELFGNEQGCIIDREADPEDKASAEQGLARVREQIMSEAYDMVILDELTIPLQLGLLKEEDVLKLIQDRPESVELIITGRGASDALIAAADLVSEIKEIRHYYNEGVLSRRGIEC